MNDYYTADAITRGAKTRSADPNANFAAIEAGFDRLPAPAALAGGMIAFGTTTGTGNAYLLSVTPSIATLTAGVTVNALLDRTNTGAATLTVGNHSPKAIRTYAGDALPAGTLIAGQTVTFRYDGSVFRLDARISLNTGEQTPAQLRAFMSLTGYADDAPIVPDQVPYTDFNDIIVPGIYNIPIPNVMGNSPDSTSGLLRVTRRSPDRVVQEWMRVTGGLTAAGRNYSRALTGAGWSAWFLDYHQGTILGAVSQSGGVPTGALVDSFTDGTTSWQKWADGTMHMARGGVTLTQDGVNQLVYSWNPYPMPFANTGPINRGIDLPFTTGNYVNVAKTDAGSTSAGRGLTGAVFAVHRCSGAANFPSNATISDCVVWAKGRWF